MLRDECIHKLKRYCPHRLTDVVFYNVWLGSHVGLESSISDTTRHSKDSLYSPATPVDDSAAEIVDTLRLVVSSRFVIFGEGNKRAISLYNNSTRVACIAANDLFKPNDCTCTSGASIKSPRTNKVTVELRGTSTFRYDDEKEWFK